MAIDIRIRRVATHGGFALITALLAAWTLTIGMTAQSEDQAIVGRWIDPPCPSNEDCWNWGQISGTLHRPHYAALALDGRVLLMRRCYTDGGLQYLWEPRDGSFTHLPSGDEGVGVASCVGIVHTADGRILIGGGTCGGFVDWVAMFNHAQGQPWSQMASMPEERWYPTFTPLPDGNILAVGGRQTVGPNANPALYDVDLDSWTAWWGEPIWEQGGPQSGLIYPRVFVIPDGRLAITGLPPATFLLDLDAPLGQEWTQIDNAGWWITRGGAVMYRPGKILRVGGRVDDNGVIQATNQAMRIDLTGSLSAPEFALWENLPPLNHPRENHDTLVVPTGHVVVLGGDDPTIVNDVVIDWEPRNHAE